MLGSPPYWETLDSNGATSWEDHRRQIVRRKLDASMDDAGAWICSYSFYGTPPAPLRTHFHDANDDSGGDSDRDTTVGTVPHNAILIYVV